MLFMKPEKQSPLKIRSGLENETLVAINPDSLLTKRFDIKSFGNSLNIAATGNQLVVVTDDALLVKQRGQEQLRKLVSEAAISENFVILEEALWWWGQKKLGRVEISDLRSIRF